jgi:hypothetical protein
MVVVEVVVDILVVEVPEVPVVEVLVAKVEDHRVPVTPAVAEAE